MLSNIYRIRFLVFILLAFVFSGFTFQDVEKPSKVELQNLLEKEFVAPCCYTEAVATHKSGKAEEVRTKISNLLDQGRTQEEITNTLVAQYGERILIKPRSLIAWVGPYVFLAIGFVLVGAYLYKVRPKGGSSAKDGTSDFHIPDEDL